MHEKHASQAHPCAPSIAMPYASNGLYLETEAGYYKLSSEAYGFVAKIDSSGNFQVLLSDRYFNKTCGLCGNCNIFAEDDFRTQEGKCLSDTISLELWLCLSFPRLQTFTNTPPQACHVYPASLHCERSSPLPRLPGKPHLGDWLVQLGLVQLGIAHSSLHRVDGW